METPYFSLKSLAFRWGCSPEAITALRNEIPPPDHEFGWKASTILKHEMRIGPEWPLCIATLDTATRIGFDDDAFEDYKSLIYKQIYEWFGHTDQYEEAKSIYEEALEVNKHE